VDDAVAIALRTPDARARDALDFAPVPAVGRFATPPRRQTTVAQVFGADRAVVEVVATPLERTFRDEISAGSAALALSFFEAFHSRTS
jgi:hypothetical protein